MLHLCERFGQPPSVIFAEDASILQMVQIENIEKARLARERDDPDGY